MRYTQAEKMETIRLVEQSELSAKQTLEELQINRSSFYEWYSRYRADGYDGLAAKKPNRRSSGTGFLHRRRNTLFLRHWNIRTRHRGN